MMEKNTTVRRKRRTNVKNIDHEASSNVQKQMKGKDEKVKETLNPSIALSFLSVPLPLLLSDADSVHAAVIGAPPCFTTPPIIV